MRIDRISLCGFTTFKARVDLDLAALGPGLIAVAGPNGAGKSTLLEAIPGCLYRTAPSRGAVANLATSRASWIELSGEKGGTDEPFTARLSVDAGNGKSEALLTLGDSDLEKSGVRVLAGPKVRDYDAAVEAHFPPLSVYLAAAFACQTGAGSLLKMERADRRALFGRLLGLEYMDRLAAAAKARGRQAEADLAGIRQALAAIREGAPDLADLESGLADAAAGLDLAAEGLEMEKSALEKWNREANSLREKRWTWLEGLKNAKSARQTADRLADQAEAVRKELTALGAILAQAPAIRKAAADVERIAGELEAVRRQGEDAAKADSDARGAYVMAKAAQVAAAGKADEAAREIERSRKRFAEAQGQAKRAKESTDAVPCAGVLDDLTRVACPALTGHFETAAEAEIAMREVGEKAIDLVEAKDAADAAFVSAATARGELEADARDKEAESERLRAEYKTLAARLTTLRSLDKSAALDRAEGQAAAIRDRLDAAEKEAAAAHAAANRAAAGLVDYGEDALKEAESMAGRSAENVRRLTLAERDARDYKTRLEAQREAALIAAAKAYDLADRIPPAEADLAEWNLLARAFGREGIQALELDAAGPRVSDLANELLSDAYGPRFQVRFETQTAKADGGVKETFDIIVVDNEAGREGKGDDLSGGEKVIVGEALGLAVGLFQAQAAGVSLGTVVRDETVGALDPENARRYLSMLRAFIRIGRVDQLLFVAHSPELVDLADAVVRVEGGQIQVGN